MRGYYLQKDVDRFELPSRLYGSIETRADKIINTYESKSGSMGVMATGFKGMGKTELMKVAANKIIDKGLPVIQLSQ